MAKEHSLGSGEMPHEWVEEEIRRHVRPDVLERLTSDGMHVYSPEGKGAMLDGGVGTVRLRPKRIDQGEVVFMSASSTGIAHEGFPVAVPESLVERLGEAREATCRVTGRLRYLPDDFDPLFRRLVGVPQLYLLADDLRVSERPRQGPVLASGAVTFETRPSFPDGTQRVPDWLPSQRYHAAYVTFAPSDRGSLSRAVEWLERDYVGGLFDGRVITDFDEQVRRFPDAAFSLERVMRRTIDPEALERAAEECGADDHTRELFAATGRRLSADACDFFVSYTSKDAAWAEWIAWRLEQAEYSVVIQAWDFHPGGDFVHDMQTAITSAVRTIAVLSPDYLKSVHGESEWRAAYAADPTGEHGILLPIRVRPCDPPGLLSTRTWVDLVALSEDRATETLLASVDRSRAKPLHPPAFPPREPAAFPAAA
jgi:hypothetical protein